MTNILSLIILLTNKAKKMTKMTFIHKIKDHEFIELEIINEAH
jgi:hypothetical protein